MAIWSSPAVRPAVAGESGHGLLLQLKRKGWCGWKVTSEEEFLQIQKGTQYFFYGHGCFARVISDGSDILCSCVFWESVGSFGWVNWRWSYGSDPDQATSLWVRLPLNEIWTLWVILLGSSAENKTTATRTFCALGDFPHRLQQREWREQDWIPSEVWSFSHHVPPCSLSFIPNATTVFAWS